MTSGDLAMAVHARPVATARIIITFGCLRFRPTASYAPRSGPE
jgi:hypothetical protein